MVILLAFFSVSNPIAFPPGKRYNEKQAKKMVKQTAFEEK